jgi:phenylacetate-CoA ligase
MDHDRNPSESAASAVSDAGNAPQLTLRDRLAGRVLDWTVTHMERHRRVWFSGPKAQSTDADWPPPVIPHAVVRAVQDIRLRRLVRYVAQKSPCYASAFARMNFDAKEFKGVSDISRLPLTTVDDLQQSEQLRCVPDDEIAHIFTTSGTSREPKLICLTQGDFDGMVNLAVNARRDQMSRERITMVAHSEGMYSVVPYLRALNARLGGLVLPIGQPTPTETLKLIDRFRPNTFVTSPTYMAAVTRAAAAARFTHGLERIGLDGEIMTAKQAQHLAEFWNAKVHNGYALTEVGNVGFGMSGCDALHLNEFQTLVEILDPLTLQPAEEGELVATTLIFRGMPLLRYRTGDRCRWVNCSCGWRAPAIRVAGRMGDDVVVAATNLHGVRIAESLSELGGLTGSAEVIVDHVNGVDRLTLRVGVELECNVQADDVVKQLFAAYPALRDDHRASAFELSVELVESMRLSPKSLRVRDLRE